MIEELIALIISGMGSGKTAAALTAMRDLLDMFAVRHWLVIAPKFVAQNTWPDELNAWTHTRAMSYAVAVGTEAQRAAAIERRAELTFINFESLQWLAKHLGSVENWYWDGLIIDESSRFKAGKKRTTRARVKGKDGQVRVRKGGNMTRFGVVSAARRKVRRVFELTGTPFPQGVHDAWGQLYLMDQGERLGRSMEAFEARWFDKNLYTHQISEKKGASDEIMALIADVVLTIPNQRLVEEPHFIPVYVHLSKKVKKEYRDFEREMFSEAYDVEAVSRGVLANKLLQFANGSMYREDGSVVEVHTEKLRALDEIIAQAQGENILVFYSFKFDKDTIKKKYSHAVIANEESDVIERWNAKKIKLLLAHAASFGHGTNLQYGGHIAVWYGLPWSLELFEQACMRLPRPGQTEQVLIYQIVAEGTYDEVTLSVLGKRGATQQDLIASFGDR
jgi:SNF2 family DNA or RNA helicase